MTRTISVLVDEIYINEFLKKYSSKSLKMNVYVMKWMPVEGGLTIWECRK